MSDGYGRDLWNLWGIFDHDMCSLRTCQDSLPLEGLAPLSVTWPKQGTLQNGQCWGRQIQVRRTKENGFLSSDIKLTLVKSDGRQSINPSRLRRATSQKVSGLDAREFFRACKNGLILSENWTLGRLNPVWCELLMGFPMGWTDVNGSGPREEASESLVTPTKEEQSKIESLLLETVSSRK